MVAVAVVAAAAWLYTIRSRPPEVPFARARRETLTSMLPTNGKVEPVEWSEVHISKPGLVGAVPVQEGEVVQKGAVLATISEPGLEAELAAAETRVAQARATLATIESGGKGLQLAEIDNDLARARFDRDQAIREHASLRRLAEKQAATAVEVAAAQDKIKQAELQIQGLERRRSNLIGKTDKPVAEAQLRDAQAAVANVRSRIAQNVVHAPIGGTVYNLKARPGSYLAEGDAVATVGRLETVRVRVYVDEPELGRVAVGQPVTITWEGLRGRNWSGAVERKPSAIVALGSRQVGEVLCTISNTGRELVPGTNVDVEIVTDVVQNALTIPKEAMRREGGAVGVLVLRRDVVNWQPLQSAVSSVTRIQITSGLKDGDAVALPTDRVLRPGQQVAPVFR